MDRIRSESPWLQEQPDFSPATLDLVDPAPIDDGVDPFHQGDRRDLFGPPALQPGVASTLLTEDARDGRSNCLDAAVDVVQAMTPQERKNAELVILRDLRPGAEGATGHVVVRQGDQIVDPSTGKRFASTEEYLKAHPQYREVGTLGAEQAKRIFDTPAGSPQRAQALARADVPDALVDMLLADVTEGEGGAAVAAPAAPPTGNVDGDVKFIKGHLDRGAFDWAVTDGNVRDVHKRMLAIVDDPNRDLNAVFDKLTDKELETWGANLPDMPEAERKELTAKMARELNEKNRARLGKVFGPDAGDIPNPVTAQNHAHSYAVPGGPVSVEYSSELEKNVTRKDGFVTVTIDAEASVSASGTLEFKRFSVGGGVSAGERVSYEVKMTEADFEKLKRGEIPPPHPLDPTSLPDKASVRVDASTFKGTSLEGAVSTTAFDLGISLGSRNGEGMSYQLSRDGNKVQVTAGPLEFFERDGKLSVGVGPVSVFHAANVSLKDYQLQTATFDLGSPEGQQAFDGFRRTGELPKQDGPGVSGALRIEKLDLEHRRNLGIEAGPFELEFNETEGNWEHSLVHHPDGTTSMTVTGQEDENSPMYSVERRYDKDGKRIPDQDKYALTFNTKDDGHRYAVVMAITGDHDRAVRASHSDDPFTVHLTPEDVETMRGRFQEFERSSDHPQGNRLTGAFQASDPALVVVGLARNIRGEGGIANGLQGVQNEIRKPFAGTVEGA